MYYLLIILLKKTKDLLADIQHTLFNNAKNLRDERIARITTWDEFIPALDSRKMVFAPWCDKTSCEDDIKLKSSEKKEEKKDNRRRSDKKKRC